MRKKLVSTLICDAVIDKPTNNRYKLFTEKLSIFLIKRMQCQSHGVLFPMEALVKIRELSISNCNVSKPFLVLNG